jgi:hypothetical protein
VYLLLNPGIIEEAAQISEKIALFPAILPASGHLKLPCSERAPAKRPENTALQSSSYSRLSSDPQCRISCKRLPKRAKLAVSRWAARGDHERCSSALTYPAHDIWPRRPREPDPAAPTSSHSCTNPRPSYQDEHGAKPALQRSQEGRACLSVCVSVQSVCVSRR